MGRLSKEEQTEVVKAAQSGDMGALRTIAEEFSTYIKYVSNNVFLSYEQAGVDLSDVSKEDVSQSGFSGLFSAVNKYDSDSNAAFSTYAYSCIAGEIKEQLRFELSHLGITNADRVIESDSFDEDNGLAEYLESGEMSALDEMIKEDERNEVKEKLEKAFATLSGIEKKVLCMINGIDCEKTSNHKKIGRELGISEMMVRDAVKEAIRKMSIVLGERR